MNPDRRGQSSNRQPGSPHRVLLVATAVVLTLALSLPSLELGFSIDDHHLLGLIDGRAGLKAEGVNLYTDFEEGMPLPWWTAPDARVDFLRPLSSALLRLDFALFGDAAFGYHVHALAWLALLVGTCGLMLSRLPRRVAGLALFAVAVEEAHALTAGVLCNRHALVAAAITLVGLHLHLRWREDGWRPGAWLAPPVFALGLGAGETALAVLAYVPAYELFGAAGHRRQRLRAGAPTIGLALAYVAVYKAAGFGSKSFNFYLDPFGAPVEFLIELPRHVAALLAGLLTGFPASLWVSGEGDYQTPLVAIGMVASTVMIWGLHRVWPHLDAERRRSLWWLAGGLASMAPVALATPSDRQVQVPAIGFSVAFAILIEFAWQRFRGAAVPYHRLAAATLGGALVLVHLGFAPISRVARQLALIEVNATIDEVSASLDDVPLSTGLQRMVLLNSTDILLSLYPPIRQAFRRSVEIDWDVLSGAPFDHRVTRVGARTLVVEPLGGQLLDSSTERLLGPPRYAPGDVVHGRVFDVKILEVNERGPTRVAYEFRNDLDDPSFHLLMLRDGALHKISPPAVGASLVVAAAGNPMPAF